MKTIRTIFRATMILVLVAFANTLMAANALSVEIQPIAMNKAVVAISSLSDSNMKITVVNKNGKVVYFKEIAGEGVYFRQPVDFSNLRNGQYKLTVVSNGYTQENFFKINKKEIKVLGSDEFENY